jgi:YrbI family 3-deoxy-D-manno-octulosonate 8-phosphate phosphatase
MQEVKIIVTDCDGVLTDGKTWVNHQGEITKGFNTKDVSAIREMISLGFEVHIITASSWPGLKKWASKTGAEVHIFRDKGQIKNIIGDQPYIAIGDDVWDLRLFAYAYASFCPSDSVEAVKSEPKVKILKSKGGSGVMAEILTYLH